MQKLHGSCVRYSFHFISSYVVIPLAKQTQQEDRENRMKLQRSSNGMTFFMSCDTKGDALTSLASVLSFHSSLFLLIQETRQEEEFSIQARMTK